VPETRDRGSDYAHEMTAGQHGDLLTFLLGLRGMVVLSGYPHPTYDAALPGWERIERKALADGARERTEVLWRNPQAVAAARNQPDLFERAA
jgi:DNA adenine methylase